LFAKIQFYFEIAKELNEIVSARKLGDGNEHITKTVDFPAFPAI
jgi:hypothetical protein